MKTIRSQILITVFIGCLAFSQITRAVIPPPDGGYPNFTTAEGQNALSNLTGSANTPVGWLSLFSNAEGSFNTATVRGHSFSIPQTTTRRLARQRFYSARPVRTIQPLALARF